MVLEYSRIQRCKDVMPVGLCYAESRLGGALSPPSSKGGKMKPQLTFDEAVSLLEHWGFEVQPGPRPSEVTVLLVGPDFRTYAVYETALLPTMAEIMLQVRLCNNRLIPGPLQPRLVDGVAQPQVVDLRLPLRARD